MEIVIQRWRYISEKMYNEIINSQQNFIDVFRPKQDTGLQAYLFDKDFYTDLIDLTSNPLGSNGFDIFWHDYIHEGLYEPVFKDTIEPTDPEKWDDDMKEHVSIIGMKPSEKKTLAKAEELSRQAQSLPELRDVMETGIEYRLALFASNRETILEAELKKARDLIALPDLSDAEKAIHREYATTILTTKMIDGATLQSDDFMHSSVFLGWEDNSNELRTILELIDAKEKMYKEITEHNADPVAHPLTQAQIDDDLKHLARTFDPLEKALADLNAKHVLSQPTTVQSSDEASDEPSEPDWMVKAKEVITEIDQALPNKEKSETRFAYKGLMQQIKRASASKKKMAEIEADLKAKGDDGKK